MSSRELRNLHDFPFQPKNRVVATERNLLGLADFLKKRYILHPKTQITSICFLGYRSNILGFQCSDFHQNTDVFIFIQNFHSKFSFFSWNYINAKQTWKNTLIFKTVSIIYRLSTISTISFRRIVQVCWHWSCYHGLSGKSAVIDSARWRGGSNRGRYFSVLSMFLPTHLHHCTAISDESLFSTLLSLH